MRWLQTPKKLVSEAVLKVTLSVLYKLVLQASEDAFVERLLHDPTGLIRSLFFHQDAPPMSLGPVLFI